MWLGGVAALLIFLPNLLWNVANDWPFVQLMRNIKAEGRDVLLSPWQYFLHQLLLINPFNSVLWITGVAALLVAARFRPYRFLAWAYLVGFTTFAVLKGKDYYLSPIYPVLLAAGAIVIDGAINQTRQPWLKPALINCVVGGQRYLRAFRCAGALGRSIHRLYD
jgi:hypothetical protein